MNRDESGVPKNQTSRRPVTSAAGSAQQLQNRSQVDDDGWFTNDEWQEMETRSPSTEPNARKRERQASQSRSASQSPLKFDFRNVQKKNKSAEKVPEERNKYAGGGDADNTQREDPWGFNENPLGYGDMFPDGNRRSPRLNPLQASPEGPVERFHQFGQDIPGSKGKWSEMKERLLCSLWQEETLLYDSTLNDYRNTDKRQAAIRRIAAGLGLEGNRVCFHPKTIQTIRQYKPFSSKT